jgi:ribose transport system substrate-binding protein
MKKDLRFIIVPKVVHPWFEQVHKGARAQAQILSRALGVDVVVEYMPPSVAGSSAQIAVLEKARLGRPDGIALDPVDAPGNMAVVASIQQDGIPLILFDSYSPDKKFTCIGTDFMQQGMIAAKRLAGLIGGKGKVAVMQGVPTAPNHRERYIAQLEVLSGYPGITIVDGGVDNDDIETAFQQAKDALRMHPDLSGYLCCDAAGPIGIAKAVRSLGKTGQVAVVGMDALQPVLDAIKERVIESSSASRPELQGSMSVLMLWQATMGVSLPQFIDTGVVLITRENVDSFLAAAS